MVGPDRCLCPRLPSSLGVEVAARSEPEGWIAYGVPVMHRGGRRLSLLAVGFAHDRGGEVGSVGETQGGPYSEPLGCNRAEGRAP